MEPVDPIYVEVRRGGLLESVHRVHAALVDAAGNLLAYAGDPRRVAYWRSAAKPLQLIPFVAAGGDRVYGLGPADLAVMAASHHGEDAHVRQVQHILARTGFDEAALQCGAHPPIDREAAERLLRAGEKPRPIHNNCSGKHAGMLAHARLLGADPARYREPDHPVQRRILETIAAFAGIGQEEVALGVDGCGVPVYALPLAAMARAYARLSRPEAAEGALALSFASADEISAAAARVVAGMQAHPHLVAGRGSANTAMLEALSPAIVAKGGAEGVYCLGHTSGWGIALKVEDGGQRAAAPAALELLALLGFVDDADPRWDEHRRPRVLNVAGRVVGEIVPVLADALRRRGQELRQAWARG